MKNALFDIFKTSAMLYGVWCFIDKLAYYRAKRIMKDEGISND